MRGDIGRQAAKPYDEVMSRHIPKLGICCSDSDRVTTWTEGPPYGSLIVGLYQ